FDGAVVVADRGDVVAEPLVRERALRVQRDLALVELIVELDRLAELRRRVARPAVVERAHTVRVQRGQAFEHAGHGVHRTVAHRREDRSVQSRRKARAWSSRKGVRIRAGDLRYHRAMAQPDVRAQVGEVEWKLRVDLAACYRLVAHFGWDDLIFTHISARLPGPEHHFLINPYGMMFDEITASSLVKIDLEGKKLLDSPFEINPAGFTIHSAIHAARDDARCVLHTHSINGVA